MRKIYLHIGQHKTGTTQIQLFLGRIPEVLALSNYEYPLLTMHSDHQYLHKYFMGEATGGGSSDVLEKVHDLINHIEKSKSNIVLSSEGLQEVDPQKVKALFSNYHVVVVAYIREQASYLFSAYQQEVKSGAEHRSYTEWFYSLGNDVGVYYLNSWIAEWEKAFGDNNVIVRIYSKAKLIEGDVLVDFLGVTGLAHISPKLKDKISTANNRIGLACHAAMRLVNSLGMPSRDILSITYDAINDLSVEEKYQSPVIGCDEFLVKKIRMRSAYENSLLANRRFNGELFDFENLPSENNCSKYLVAQALISILSKSFRRHPRKTAKIAYALLREMLSFRIILFLFRYNLAELRAKCIIRESSFFEVSKENSTIKSELNYLSQVLKDKDSYICHLEGLLSNNSSRTEVRNERRS